MYSPVALLCVVACAAAYQVDPENPTNWENQPTIVMKAPQPDNDYYQEMYQQIIQFHKNICNAAIGKDNVVILGNAESLKPYRQDLPDDILLDTVVIDDIWIRDFSPARMDKQVVFKYENQFNTPEDTARVQGQFLRFLDQCQLREFIGATSQLKNDGGNVVDNLVDTAVVTTRIVDDNKQYSATQIKEMLKKELGYPNVYMIPAVPGDTTGHADGMASFVDTDVLALTVVEGDPKPDYKMDPSIHTFAVGGILTEEPKWKNISSACGWHLNILATNDFLYVPTYGTDPDNSKWGHTTARDVKILKLIQANSNKLVVPVETPNGVCKTGGAVRCNTWQLSGPMANRLIQKARQGKCV